MGKNELALLRAAVAEYMWSEGCSCCRNVDAHDKNREALAKLLRIKKRDNWYDFSKFRRVDRTTKA